MRETAGDRSFSVNQIPFSVYGARRWSARKRLHAFTDGARKVDIIGIQPGEDRAASHAEALVDGVRLPTVVFGDKSQAAGVILNHSGRFIGRATVHDNVLHIRIILAEHTLNGRADEFPLVKGWCDDADGGMRHYVNPACPKIAMGLS